MFSFKSKSFSWDRIWNWKPTVDLVWLRTMQGSNMLKHTHTLNPDAIRAKVCKATLESELSEEVSKRDQETQQREGLADIFTLSCSLALSGWRGHRNSCRGPSNSYGCRFNDNISIISLNSSFSPSETTASRSSPENPLRTDKSVRNKTDRGDLDFPVQNSQLSISRHWIRSGNLQQERRRSNGSKQSWLLCPRISRLNPTPCFYDSGDTAPDSSSRTCPGALQHTNVACSRKEIKRLLYLAVSSIASARDPNTAPSLPRVNRAFSQLGFLTQHASLHTKTEEVWPITLWLNSFPHKSPPPPLSWSLTLADTQATGRGFTTGLL